MNLCKLGTVMKNRVGIKELSIGLDRKDDREFDTKDAPDEWSKLSWDTRSTKHCGKDNDADVGHGRVSYKPSFS